MTSLLKHSWQDVALFMIVAPLLTDHDLRVILLFEVEAFIWMQLNVHKILMASVNVKNKINKWHKNKSCEFI